MKKELDKEVLDAVSGGGVLWNGYAKYIQLYNIDADGRRFVCRY